MAGLRPEPCPGDELLRALLWRPPAEWEPAAVWGYFSSRPRRLHLEPRLARVLAARFSSRGARLDVRVVLAPRRRAAGRWEGWLPHEDLLLNPAHAAVLARYHPLYDARTQPADVPCAAVKLKVPSRPSSPASSAPSSP